MIASFNNFLSTKVKDDWLLCATRSLLSGDFGLEKGYAGNNFLKRYVDSFRTTIEMKIRMRYPADAMNDLPSDDEECDEVRVPAVLPLTPSRCIVRPSSTITPSIRQTGTPLGTRANPNQMPPNSTQEANPTQSTTPHITKKRKPKLTNPPISKRTKRQTANDDQPTKFDEAKQRKRLERKKGELAKLRKEPKKKITCSDCRSSLVKYKFNCGHIYCKLCMDYARKQFSKSKTKKCCPFLQCVGVLLVSKE